MALPDSWSFRGRLVLVLALLVVLNALFVTALVWAYGTVIPTAIMVIVAALFTGTVPPVDLLSIAVAPATLAGLVIAFLLGQLWFGYTRVLRDVRAETCDPEEYPSLHETVTWLSAMADVMPPRIAVVDAERPTCFTIGAGRGATIVVTSSLLAVLDTDELEAVLAHELAHIKNRDVTLMTVTSLFLTIAERAYRITGLLGRVVGTADRQLSADERTAKRWLFPLLVVSYVFVAPILWLFPPVATLANSTLARDRELAADEAAATITGAPLALASALTTLYDYAPPQPDRDLRRTGLGALGIVPHGVDPTLVASAGTTAPDRGGEEIDGSEQSESRDDRDRRAEIDDWLDGRETLTTRDIDTHPPVELRIDRLVELSTERGV